MLNKNSIYFRNILDRRKSLTIWTVALSLLTMLIIAMYDSVGREAAQLFENSNFTAFFGGDVDTSSPAGWLGFELYAIFLPICLAIITIGIGASTIGSEEESGTLELLLASPINRSRIIIEKAMMLITVAVIIPVLIFLTVCLFRGMKGHFTSEHHFGFEAAAWYWHFVDVVWLFLFAAIYIWGS